MVLNFLNKLPGRVNRFMRTHGLVVYDPNWLLIFFSLAALTRGVLYAFPDVNLTPLPVPQGGISLLPKELTYIYGALWLMVAIFGIYAGFRHVLVWLAKILVFTMFVVWSVIYVVGAIQDMLSDGNLNRTLWMASLLFASLGAGVLYRPKRGPEYVYVLVPAGLIKELRDDQDLTPDKLLKELHRHVTTPERLLMSLQVQPDDE